MNNENPDYVDPSKPDPQFPGRPTHSDFVRLSEVIQDHDHRTQNLKESPFEVLGVDETSFMYFLENRLGIFAAGLRMDPAVAQSPVFQALYIDAFALGKAFGEKAADSE